MKKNNIFLFIFGILSGVFFTLFVNVFQLKFENFLFAQISQTLSEVIVKEIPKIPPLQLNSKSVLSIRFNEKKKMKERIVYAKNEKEILPIASLTKLMTALIVIENPEHYPFNKVVKVSTLAASQENVPEYGNLRVGETVTIEELLRLTLVFSSNDAAFALAEVIGVESFVQKMNEKAREIGMVNTYFSNPTGLDPDNLSWSLENKDNFNYSTANDLFLLGKYIIEKYPFMFEFSSNNKNKIELRDDQFLIGMKTGYTSEAGGCLFLIFSNHQGDYFFNIILGSNDKEERFVEMQKLVNWLNGKY